jgi:hypothetical protein
VSANLAVRRTGQAFDQNGSAKAMNPSLVARTTARKLLAYEAGAGKSSENDLSAAVRVSEKLRRPLSTLAGASGFRALLGRALMLAKAQDPALAAVRVQPDGSLEGWSELCNKEGAQAGLELIAQLLGLLNAFIGPDLAWRLVGDVWPDLPAPVAEADEEKEQ